MNATEAAASLRRFADWIEENTATTLSGAIRGEGLYLYEDQLTFYWRLDDKEGMQKAVKALGGGTKHEQGNDLHVDHSFGLVNVTAYTARENVCEKIVVGKRVVPAVVIPASEEKVVPEHVEEVVEWVCSPILSPLTEQVEGVTS